MEDSETAVEETVAVEAKPSKHTYANAIDYESEGGLEREVEVSVVLPAKDEEETIGVCIDKIKKVFDNHNIIGEIIVSDSSQDRTPIIARDHGAKVVTPDRKGYGYAYIFAFKYANGKFIVMGDADDTYDFFEIPAIIEPLKVGEADLVIGSRFRGKMEKGAMPWLHKWIGNPILTWFLNFFFKVGVSDAHCGFRATTREALRKLDLCTDGMEFASEMMKESAVKGLRIKEVPISYYKRKNKNSKLSSFSDGWRHLKFMLMYAPNYLFIFPGTTLLLIGLTWIVFASLKIFIGYFPGVHSMVAGSLLIIAGYQAIFFGLFTKAYQGKGMPRFLTLEKGAVAGAILILIGAIYASYLVLRWVGGGPNYLPPIESDIISFTLIVLGLETFFSSFMLSITAMKKKREY